MITPPSNNLNNIRIFTVYHKPMPTIDLFGYTPIFVGNSIRNSPNKDGISTDEDYRKFFDNVLTDDALDSENISDLNRNINEMTAVYWLWKHYDFIGNLEYIGLSHYRRFFAFNENISLSKELWLPFGSTVCYEHLSDISNIIDITYARKIFSEGVDIICSKKYDAFFLNDGDYSCRDRFCHIANWEPSLYDAMESIVLEKFPDYAIEICSLRESASHYLFNMFVMKKNIFFEYCNFVFGILFELLEKCHFDSDVLLARAPGFLSEFLTSMFISHKVRKDHIDIKELHTIYIKNPEFDRESISIIQQPMPVVHDDIQPDSYMSFLRLGKRLYGKDLSLSQIIYLFLRKTNIFKFFHK